MNKQNQESCEGFLLGILVAIGALVLDLCCSGCRTNSSGWPVIWGMNNGQTYSQPNDHK